LRGIPPIQNVVDIVGFPDLAYFLTGIVPHLFSHLTVILSMANVQRELVPAKTGSRIGGQRLEDMFAGLISVARSRHLATPLAPMSRKPKSGDRGTGVLLAAHERTRMPPSGKIPVSNRGLFGPLDDLCQYRPRVEMAEYSILKMGTYGSLYCGGRIKRKLE